MSNNEFKSSYIDYKELIWKVVESAIEVGIDEAYKTVQSYGTGTKNEILGIAGVSEEDYKKECYDYFSREINIRRALGYKE